MVARSGGYRHRYPSSPFPSALGATSNKCPRPLCRTEPTDQADANKLVLAIDDDPDVIYLLRESLAEVGYRVIGALSGREGLQKARELRPLVMTLDLLMPRMDGFALIEQLQLAPTPQQIPVIVFTAQNAHSC